MKGDLLLGQKLSKIRKARDYQATQIAKIINETISTISMAEKGSRLPTSDTLMKMLKIYELNIEEIQELLPILQKYPQYQSLIDDYIMHYLF